LIAILEPGIERNYIRRIARATNSPVRDVYREADVQERHL
jgi:hypothetical protein